MEHYFQVGVPVIVLLVICWRSFAAELYIGVSKCDSVGLIGSVEIEGV